MVDDEWSQGVGKRRKMQTIQTDPIVAIEIRRPASDKCRYSEVVRQQWEAVVYQTDTISGAEGSSRQRHQLYSRYELHSTAHTHILSGSTKTKRRHEHRNGWGVGVRNCWDIHTYDQPTEIHIRREPSKHLRHHEGTLRAYDGDYTGGNVSHRETGTWLLCLVRTKLLCSNDVQFATTQHC